MARGFWARRGTKSAVVKDHRRRVKFERQGGACHWCGAAMTLELGPNPAAPPRNFATFEHVVRRCEGGAGMPNNVVLACASCNNERGERPGYPVTDGTGWALV